MFENEYILMLLLKDTQGSEWAKICLVLVPLFSATPKNVLVLVLYFSASSTKH